MGLKMIVIQAYQIWSAMLVVQDCSSAWVHELLGTFLVRVSSQNLWVRLILEYPQSFVEPSNCTTFSRQFFALHYTFDISYFDADCTGKIFTQEQNNYSEPISHYANTLVRLTGKIKGKFEGKRGEEISFCCVLCVIVVNGWKEEKEELDKQFH